MNKAFSVTFFIFMFMLSLNIINAIGAYQYQLTYDLSYINQTSSQMLALDENNQYTPSPLESATYIFGQFWLGLNLGVGILLQSTVYMPIVLEDLGVPTYFAYAIAIPYNIIFWWWFIKFVANRVGF